MFPRVRLATLDEAPIVHATMLAAFAEYADVLSVSSSAHAESVDDVRAAMQQGGAVLGFSDQSLAGVARYRVDLDALHVGRVSVLPDHRRRGVATAMMRFLEKHAASLGLGAIRVVARESLPSNVELYRRLGYGVVKIVPHPRGPDREVWLEKSTT